MSKIRQNKGITLVALVITIILIVLLSAITISSLTGSGLFEQAKEAKRRQKIAEMEEKLNLAVTQTTLEKNRNITIDDYINTLIKNGIIGEGDIEDIENGKMITTDGGLLFELTTDEAGEIEIEYVGTTETMIPTISLNVIGSTTNTIKVSTISRRNKEGTIEYYIKKENDNYSKEPSYKETNIENGKTYTYEFENLDQEQKYIIKAVAVGTNGKKEEEEKEWTTGVIPELIAKDISFSYEPDNWTNGPVKVTANIVNEEVVTTGFTLRLTNNITTDATTWPTATEGLTVSTNGEIYALLVDGRGQIGKSNATGNVEKIDTQIPVANITNATTNSITFTGTDTAKTGESASGIAGYMIKENSTKPNATDTGWESYDGTSKTVNGLTQGRTYHLFVKDNAENVSEVASEGTGTVTSGLITGAITFSKATWSGGKATVTISTNTNYTIQYQKNSVTGTWITGTNVTNLTHNDIVYARLIDTTGQTGDTGTDTNNYASTNIVDGVNPTIGSAKGSTTTGNTGTVTVSNIADTGGSGLKGIYISQNSTAPTATSVTWTPNTNSQYSITVSSNGTYYVWVIDNVGNISDVSIGTVSGIVNKISISSYSDASVIAPNTVTPTLSYSGTPKTITYSSSDVTVATVNSSGVVTGKKVGKTTITATAINYDGTSVTATCIVRVSEYLLYYGDKKVARTGGWSFARGATGASPNWDSNASNDNGLEFTLNDSGAYGSWSTNNKINVDEIGRMRFLVTHWTNHSDLLGKICLSFSYDKSAEENLYWWNEFTFNSEAVTREINFWCGDTTGDYYIKFYGEHYEFQGYTVFEKLHYVLAEPKLY